MTGCTSIFGDFVLLPAHDAALWQYWDTQTEEPL